MSDLINAIAPELEGDTRLPVFLDLADAQTSQTAFRDQRDYAVALLAAHMATVASRNGAAGRVSSVSEGQLSTAFNVVGFDGELSTTSYGVELLRLRRAYIITARTRVVG